MKTLRKLSNRKLDELQKRLEKKPIERRWRQVYLMWRIMNERLRRIGL